MIGVVIIYSSMWHGCNNGIQTWLYVPLYILEVARVIRWLVVEHDHLSSYQSRKWLWKLESWSRSNDAQQITCLNG